jgi:hypothetical protein
LEPNLQSGSAQSADRKPHPWECELEFLFDCSPGTSPVCRLTRQVTGNDPGYMTTFAARWSRCCPVQGSIDHVPARGPRSLALALRTLTLKAQRSSDPYRGETYRNVRNCCQQLSRGFKFWPTIGSTYRPSPAPAEFSSITNGFRDPIHITVVVVYTSMYIRG